MSFNAWLQNLRSALTLSRRQRKHPQRGSLRPATLRPSVEVLEDRTAPAAGMLDPTFGVGGRMTTRDPIPATGIGSSTAIDSLGRIVVAGYRNLDGTQLDFAVARYTPAGVLDLSFGGTGVVMFGIGSYEDIANSVVIDSLDRVVVAGYSNNGSNNDFAVARLTVAGTLDTSFDGDGKRIIAFGTSTDIAHGVTVDSLDRVVVAGSTFDSINDHVAVVRLTATGALDNSFDGDGKQTFAFGASTDEGYGVAVDSLDRVVVAGSNYNGSSYDFAVARLTTAGALDGAFDGDGKQTISFGPGNDGAQSVAIDSLGRIVLAGGTTNGSTVDFAVARLTAAGALDSSFDGDGKQTVSFAASSNEYSFGVDVDSLDRIVAVGNTNIGSTDDFAVARLTGAGALDISFDGDGKQTIAFGPDSDLASGVDLDALDRVVVAGSTHNGNDYDFAVARLTTAGALDNSFNGDGRRTIAFGDSTDEADAVAVDSLDRIVIAGYTYDTSNFNFTFDFAVARLNVTGALDTSFDGDGRQTIAFGSTDDIGFGVAVDSHDRVVVAGYTGDGTNDDFAVARLTAAGALDTSFDADGRQTIDFGGTDFANGVAIASADRVVLGGFSIYNDEVFAVARLTGDTTTATAQVNDGSVQRSRVTSLTVRFSGQVTFSGMAEQAFTLVRDGGGAVSFTASVSVQYGGTVVTLNNFTGTDTEFGSLADGRYTLSALASQISAGGQALDGDADGVAGGNFVFSDAQGLFRYYGDVNGDQTVNGLDFGVFRYAFGTQNGDPNYLSYLDFNGDGVINGFDFGQFKTRFGNPLP